MEEMKDEMIHAPDGGVHPTKSALVTKKTRKKKKAVHLTWDEHQIEEHDQLRGTRMKVGEHTVFIRLVVGMVAGICMRASIKVKSVRRCSQCLNIFSKTSSSRFRPDSLTFVFVD